MRYVQEICNRFPKSKCSKLQKVKRHQLRLNSMERNCNVMRREVRVKAGRDLHYDYPVTPRQPHLLE